MPDGIQWRTTSLATTLSVALAYAAISVSPAAGASVSDDAIDHGIYMRGVYGLNASRDYVAKLAGSPADVGSAEYGVPLTRAEVKELDIYGRTNYSLALQNKVLPYVESLPTYAGEWLDQKDGGKLVVMLTKRQDSVIDGVRSRLPKSSKGVRFEIVESSYDELLTALERAPAVVQELAPGGRYSMGEVNIQKNRLDITVTAPAAESLTAKGAALEARLGVSVKVKTGPQTKQVENCGNGTNVYNCWNPLRAAIRVKWKTWDNSWICSMGFHIEKNGNPEWLTAGHCVKHPNTGSNPPSYASNEMFHSKWYHNTSGNTNTVVKVGNMQATLYTDSKQIDAARIAFLHDDEVSNRIYGTGTPYVMGGAKWPLVGDKLWGRGATTIHISEDWQGDPSKRPPQAYSGFVKVKNANWWSETGGRYVYGATMGGFTPEKGDSGGAIYSKTVLADGTTKKYNPYGIINDTYPEGTGKCAFAKVKKVLNEMGATLYTGD